MNNSLLKLADFPKEKEYEVYIEPSPKNPLGSWSLSICSGDEWLNTFYYNSKKAAESDFNRFFDARNVIAY